MKNMRKLLAAATILAVQASVLSPLQAQQYQREAQQQATENVPLSQFQNEQYQLWNFDWLFLLGNPENAQTAELNDSQWRKLDLPHDFQFEQPWQEDAGGARGFKPMCDGWYRKHFQAPESWKGKRVVIDFEGVMYYCDVYVNGEKVASNEYGYTGFEAEVSRQLKYGQDNVVAVYASTGKTNGSRWYTGGGIFRNVHLRLQNPTHIARHGIYVATPQVCSQEAQVQVTVDVEGFRKHETTVRATLLDREGKAVGSAEATMNQLTKHRHDEVQLPLISIANPQRWDLESPYLYKVEVEVWADSMLVDRQSDRFGIRTIEFGPQYGFKLNGRKVFLKGIANHHDMGALGVAAYRRGLERQLKTMKQFGYNSIRCSHNPYSKDLTDLCDSLGLLVVDELIDKWSDDEYWGGRTPFMQLWPSLIKEWVTRDRNNPSVVLWSLGNELQTRDSWSGYATNDWGITTYRIFREMVRRYDSSRLTTVAQFPARAGAIREEPEFKTYFAPPELGVATEVSSFNYQWDKYPNYFEYAPNMILYQSEAVTNQLQAPFYGMDQQRTVGLAYWGAIEYWGESNGWPKKGWNFSFFSHTLQPYPQAYMIKGCFEPENPMVRIAIRTGGESVDWNDVKVGQKTYTSFWNYKEGATPNVTTFTNAPQVELVCNEQSLGTKQNDTTDVFKRGVITWEKVPYGEGGTLLAIARDNNGNELSRHQIETAGKAVALKVEAETPDEWRADGMDLQYLNIYAVDSKGRQVPGFTEDLTFSLDGEATFLALDNGDHYTNLLFHDVTSKPMRQGYMQMVLRSTRQKGKVSLTVSAGGLKKTIKLQTR